MATIAGHKSDPSTGDSPWTDKLLQAITARLDSVPTSTHPLSQIDPNKAADAMFNTLVEVMTEGSPEEDLGPFFSTSGLSRRLGVTRQALDGRITRRTLLALMGDDGSRLYPVFQFIGEGAHLKVLPGLPRVLKALAEVDDEPIAIAAWLTAETSGLDEGSSAVEHLRNGGAVEQVLDLVNVDAERLTH